MTLLPTISPELSHAARQALAELQLRRVTLDPGLMITLEGSRDGNYNSEAHQVITAIRQAKIATDAHDAAGESARAEKAARVKVRVFVEAGPARKYTPGVYSLSPEELQALEAWAKRIESGRGSLSSRGHKTWPAYVLE